MRRILSVVLTLTFMGASAYATDLNLSVQSDGGLSEITVAPGARVNYKIMGILSDDLNEGLALFGLDLVFDGGNLEQANSPPVGAIECVSPMLNFVIPEGITNPAGFGGTVFGVDPSEYLVQIGGGQNTIKNTEANADFPIGMVLLGVAQPAVCGEAVLVTGSLLAPPVEGAYNLTIPLNSVFANVIREGEVIENVFLATDAAGVGTVSNLIINVGGVVNDANLMARNPLDGDTLWRFANQVIELTFDADITLPAAGEVQIRDMLPAGAFGADVSASMVIEVINDGGANPRILKITDTTGALVHRSWYSISPNAWSGVTAFEAQYVMQVGDANNDSRVLFSDLGTINESIPCFSDCIERRDINGDNRVLFSDLGTANTSIPSFTVAKPDGH